MPSSKDVTVILAAVFLSGVLSLWVANTRGSSPEGVRPISTLYDEIRTRGHIRAGYAVGAPYFMKDPNTKEISGIFADVLEEVAQGLRLDVEWVEEVGYGQMIEALRARRFDIVGSGVWVNANRATGVDFTRPILYDAVGAYVRHDDRRFDYDLSVADSSEIRISTIDGEMAASIAASDFPRAATLALPQTSEFTQMILNVVDRKADLTFLGLGPARLYQSRNPGSIRNINPDSPVRIFATAMMVPIGQHELRRALDLALIQLQNDGRIDRIIAQYEETPGSHYRLARPFASLP